MKKAFFFDRDGTLNRTILRKSGDGFLDSWPITPSEFELAESAVEVVNYIKINGYIPIVITNQRGVYEGAFSVAQYEEMTKRLCDGLDISRTQVFECFHGKDFYCFCRKPKPGLLLMAKGVYEIDLLNSWIVGDSTSDIQAGYGAGLRNALFLRREPIGEIQIGNREEEEKVYGLSQRSVDKPRIISRLSDILSLDILKPELIE